MMDAGQPHPLRVRWVRPSWLTWEQARTYSSLPARVLRNLIADRRLRTRATSKGRLISRDSIDRFFSKAHEISRNSKRRRMCGSCIFFGTVRLSQTEAAMCGGEKHRGGKPTPIHRFQLTKSMNESPENERKTNDNINR